MIENKTTLFELLRQGATVITPNNRLSQQLLEDYYQYLGTTIDDKPPCLPYQAFLQKLFTQIRHQCPHQRHPIVLTALQQRHLWQQILSYQTEYPCNDGLIRNVQEAWTRCQLWQIDIQHPSFATTPQTRQFQVWHQQFQHQLTELFAITAEQLIPYVLPYLKHINLPTVIWTCFDDYTPLQTTLQHHLGVVGCEQQFYDLAPQSTPTFRFAAKDRQDEYLQLIKWLKERLQNDEKRIGVVIPDLQGQEKSLQRLLQRHIMPEKFNISLGGSLLDYPLVAHALQWLQLGEPMLTNQQARLLLHSPYLAGAKTEFIARTQQMQTNVTLHELHIPLAFFIQECASTAPILANRLATLTDYPKQASPVEWVTHFKTRLINIGFPGDASLNSASYQCLQRFISLLDELRELNVVTPQMSQQQALNALLDATQTTIFQARKAKTPIQILGLLEASGGDFDSVWICSLTDQCLPQKTQFSAFIPIDLQRTHQMPHAVAARELQFAQQLLQRLRYGSRLNILSYPRLIGDTPNLPSPLIIDFPLLTVTNTPLPPPPVLLTSYTENYALSLRPNESIVGGTQALANQAKCPFRGFAAHRLHAKEHPDASTGPDASERGQVVHRVMEKLWQRLGSQNHLIALSPTVLNEYIEQAIVNALEPLIQNRSFSFSPLIQEVEGSRLKRLVNACLEWEKQRSAFEIEALEQTFTINLAGIEFRVRIDRLDKILSETPQKWVIDYKTSIPANKPWHEERPEAPQLLLYALLDNSINALLFVQLKAGRVICSGFSEEVSSVRGISNPKKGESWASYQNQWQQQLTLLAQELHDGHCPPQPTRTSTCESCEFQNLCRIER